MWLAFRVSTWCIVLTLGVLPLLQDHYIGVDVGTGSARACIIDETGDIKALASKDIKLWQPENGYYVRTVVGQQSPRLPRIVDN